MARVPVGPEESEFIRRRIERFAEEAPAELHWQVEHVRVNQALPLYVGWTETAGIRADGTLVRWVTEDVTNTHELADDTWINLALVQGATRYPELRGLIPARPTGAKTCEGCKGAGRIPGMAANVICACGGIGWLPPGSGT
jgi:hypothetical protein